MSDDAEDVRLRSAAMQISQSILVARARGEQELRRTNDAFQRLAKASVAIASAPSIDAVLATITEQCREVIGAHQAIARLTIDETRARATSSVSLSEKYAAYRSYEGTPNGSGIDALVCRSGAPMRMTQPELEAHPAWLELGDEAARHPPMRGWLAAPLIGRDGTNLGLVQLSDKYEGEFDEIDEATLVQLCQLAATSVENVRLYEKVVTRARHSALAAQVGAILMADQPLPARLSSIAREIVDALGAAFARIWTFDEHDRVLVLQASAGLYTHVDGAHARIPIGQFKIGRIAESRTPHLTNSVHEDPNISDPAWARREGVVAFAGHPLLVGGQLVGVLAMFARQPMTPDTLTIIGQVADRIALGVERDRTDQEREERERFRELFIGMLGHDLRNPLAAISTGLSLLEMTGDTVDHRPRAVARMRNSAERMGRMIDQILDFTRLRSGGGIPVNRAPGDLHEICRAVVDEMQAAYPGREIDTRWIGDARGSWDADRLSQVFSNLLGNALAYGDPQAPVRVLAHDDHDHVVVQVNNEGPPIPPDVLPLVFDPFRRAQQAKVKGTKGLGLGLYITRQIVIAHGGTIEVKSAAGATTFRLRMPREHRSLDDA